MTVDCSPQSVPVLSLEAVSLAYDRPVLQSVSLAVHAGEIVTVIGANGAGKSSLLRLLAGDMAPAAGQVRFAGQPLVNWPRRQLACQLAVLPQQTQLSFPFRVAEVVAMGCIPHSAGAGRDKQVIAAALSALDITHLQNANYLTLSGGEQQRVQLARVLAQLGASPGVSSADVPRALILDEPVTGLDIQYQTLWGQVLQDLKQDGVAIVQVLHDLNLALRVSDTCLALRTGKTVAAGPVDAVIEPAVLRKVFDVDMQRLTDPAGKTWVVKG